MKISLALNCFTRQFYTQSIQELACAVEGENLRTALGEVSDSDFTEKMREALAEVCSESSKLHEAAANSSGLSTKESSQVQFPIVGEDSSAPPESVIDLEEELDLVPYGTSKTLWEIFL